MEYTFALREYIKAQLNFALLILALELIMRVKDALFHDEPVHPGEALLDVEVGLKVSPVLQIVNLCELLQQIELFVASIDRVLHCRLVVLVHPYESLSDVFGLQSQWMTQQVG